MPIVVTADQLSRLNALRKMEQAFPNESSAFKERKKQWWAEIRVTHGIPSSAKLKLGTETGTLLDKATNEAYEAPLAPPVQYAMLSKATAASVLADWIEDVDYYDHDIGTVDADQLPETEMLSSDNTEVLVSDNSVFVKLS